VPSSVKYIGGQKLASHYLKPSKSNRLFMVHYFFQGSFSETLLLSVTFKVALNFLGSRVFLLVEHFSGLLLVGNVTAAI